MVVLVVMMLAEAVLLRVTPVTVVAVEVLEALQVPMALVAEAVAEPDTEAVAAA
jgi:hypothetical protein